ncbi:MAG TPA: hypothetical protein VIV54_24790 [Burkholderiales bacterium]
MTPRRDQRGVVAVVLLLSILALGASYYMVSRLEAMSMQAKAFERQHNAGVLNRAKQALIGYVAAQASKAYEDNPGALPCPEAAGYYDDPSNEGKTASSCTLPKVGRLPWRTLGLEKLLDYSGEPLWYVVSPGWARTSGNTLINANTIGQLSLDGTSGTDGDTIVALIIAPGPAMVVTAATGCTAWTQSRPTSGTPDWRNYLECENATSPADSSFVSTGPSTSFNDQVVKVTKADIMPGIEAAIANRIEREIAPLVKNVYATSSWSLSSSNPVFPYPAPFANPGTSTYQGSAGTTAGLLPVTSQACSGDPRCSSTFVAWNQGITPTVQYTGGAADFDNLNCSFISSTEALCYAQYKNTGSMTVRMAARARNVAMALRKFDTTQVTAQSQVFGTWTNATVTSAAGTLNSDGSGTIYVNVSLPYSISNSYFYIVMDIGLLADLLDSTNSLTGWYVRNEWYRLTYYAVTSRHTAAVLPTSPACTTGVNCLSVTNVTPSGAQRAILILAGRSINNATRPSATLGDYLEFGNASGSYERQTVSSVVAAGLKRPFNDRIVVVDTN